MQKISCISMLRKVLQNNFWPISFFHHCTDENLSRGIFITTKCTTGQMKDDSCWVQSVLLSHHPSINTQLLQHSCSANGSVLTPWFKVTFDGLQALTLFPESCTGHVKNLLRIGLETLNHIITCACLHVPGKSIVPWVRATMADYTSQMSFT